MTVKSFYVVTSGADGGVAMYPMKEWLRLHPENVPPGLDATLSTSHQLRNGLRKLGWSVNETPTEVRLTMPGSTDTEAVIGDSDETIDPEAPGSEAGFQLEYQLRDFIAQNLGTITVEGKRRDTPRKAATPPNVGITVLVHPLLHIE